MSPVDELFDSLARLVGTLNPDDIADDPVLGGLLSQLVQILEPRPTPLPLHLLEQLMAIDNRMERFKAAAEAVKAYDPARLKQLSESLRSSGLLKNAPSETAVEDLMKEHSVLRRFVAIYKKAMEGPLNIEALKQTAKLVKLYVHEYHEKMEEEYVFPRMKDQMPALVEDLCKQHLIVRKLTDTIIESNNPADISEAAKEFIRIYTPHGVMEDTELFPAWRNSLTPESYDTLGRVFSETEKAIFGEDGEEKILEIVTDLEKQLGISELPT